jgi:signal transduction histidine kinase
VRSLRRWWTPFVNHWSSKDLRVVAASRSFYVKFSTDPGDTQGKHFYALGDGEWDIPKLRLLLEKIIPDQGTMDEYEVEHGFPRIGHRVMLLNACIVRYEKAHTNILLSIEDITTQRNLEREKDELLRQKGVLLDEVQRRVHASAAVGSMEMQPYLSKLCEALAHSMIGEDQSISLKVLGKGGIATCRDAESLGLIVTEVVINALKHAFNADTKNGRIPVSYEVAGTDWKLSIADNGIGRPDGVFAQPKSGLGTGIVKALAKQLNSQVVTSSGSKGTTVSVTHATFAGRDAQDTPATA